MIVFDLACECGYSFEGWFQDREQFEEQLASTYLECPLCGGREIHKILSPIRFQSSSTEAEIPANQDNSGEISAVEINNALKTIQKFVEINFEDVGTDLTNEALKMHYGVIEPKNIRGIATEPDEKKLKEEGINLLKIPMRSKNDNTQ
jgi:hypothetical protein